MPNEKIKTEKYIDILDRYLEVAFVYHEKMGAHKKGNIEDRIDRVVNSLEELKPTNGQTVNIIPDSQGQNIAPDEMLINLTKIYQAIIVKRLQKPGYAIQPRNTGTIKELMEESPEVFLGAFNSTSSAWDALNEAASICFLPDLTLLEYRDLICMHSLELRQHLSRILAQEMIRKPSSILPLQGEISVEKLQHVSKAEDIIRIIVSRPAFWSNDFRRLTDQVKEHFSQEAKKLFEKIELDKIETAIFPFMDENLDFSKIKNENAPMTICQKMVVYGINMAYLAWISACDIIKQKEDTELLARHMLFATRMLLDERYWLVCTYVANLAYQYRLEINIIRNSKNTLDKSYMLFANKLFAEKMAGKKNNDQVKEEAQAWDVNNAHSRYLFLKYILLEDYKTAKHEGEKLLEIDDFNHQMNITSKELKTWPILEAFRSTEEGKALIQMAMEKEQELSKK